MRPLQDFHRVLGSDEVDRLHGAAVELLADPGLRIENPTLCAALQRQGARVDAETVRFPLELIERTLALAAVEERTRLRAAGDPGARESAYPDQLTFSWHTPFRDRALDAVQASISGGTPPPAPPAITPRRPC